MKINLKGSQSGAVISLILIGVFIVSSLVSAQTSANGSLSRGLNLDMRRLADGYRASKIVGATVYNDATDAIGKVDYIIKS